MVGYFLVDTELYFSYNWDMERLIEIVCEPVPFDKVDKSIVIDISPLRR